MNEIVGLFKLQLFQKIEQKIVTLACRLEIEYYLHMLTRYSLAAANDLPPMGDLKSKRSG